VLGPRNQAVRHADVAQLVAHHLAKVRVAGSNPVVRSMHRLAAVSGRSRRCGHQGGVAEWLRQGPAKPCTRVRFPPPPRTTTTGTSVHIRAISSVGEHYLDTVGVTGSIPVSPTTNDPDFGDFEVLPMARSASCCLFVAQTGRHAAALDNSERCWARRAQGVIRLCTNRQGRPSPVGCDPLETGPTLASDASTRLTRARREPARCACPSRLVSEDASGQALTTTLRKPVDPRPTYVESRRCCT
jgi:hypothetical protein